MRVGDQGRDQGDHSRPAGRGVPVARSAAHVHEMRPGRDCQGDVGEGVLIVAEAEVSGEKRVPEAGAGTETAFRRDGGIVRCEGVPLPEIAAAAGTPAY